MFLFVIVFYLLFKAHYNVSISVTHNLPGSNSSQIVIIDDDIVPKIFYFNAQSDIDVQEVINAGLIIRHKLNKNR